MFVLQYINILSKDSKKKKDLIACFLIIFVGMFLGIVVHIFEPFVDYFLLFFQAVVQSIMKIIDLKSTSFQEFTECFDIIQKIFADLNHSMLKMVFVSFILMTLTFMMIYFLKVKRVWLMLIAIILEFVINSIAFPEVKFLIFLTVTVLMMMQGLIPIGSGSYYKVIQYAVYIPCIYHRRERKEDSSVKILSFILFFLTLGAMFAFLMNSVWPYLSKKVSFLLYIAILILVWMNQCSDLTTKMIRKLICYSLIVIVVLLDNNSFDIGGLSPILALVSIFFAVERVISLAKDLAKRVENQSFLFLIDEINDDELLLEKRLEIPLEVVEKLSEDQLIRQIVINYKLKLFSEALEMIDVYKTQNFTKEFYVIRGLELEILFANNEISIEDAEEKLEEIFSFENKGLNFGPLNQNYALVLFLNDKDYSIIIDLLWEFWLLLDDEMKFVLYYAFLNQNRSRDAEKVKREINNFEEVRFSVMETRKEYINDKIAMVEK